MYTWTTSMNANIYLKLQKKYGGRWVATSKSGRIVYAAARGVKALFTQLKRKNITPQKTAIGHIQKHGQVSVYLSIPVQDD